MRIMSDFDRVEETAPGFCGRQILAGQCIGPDGHDGPHYASVDGARTAEDPQKGWSGWRWAVAPYHGAVIVNDCDGQPVGICFGEQADMRARLLANGPVLVAILEQLAEYGEAHPDDTKFWQSAAEAVRRVKGTTPGQ